VNWTAALITAAIFLFSGFYKALEPYSFARLAQELMVWPAFTMPLTWVLASTEILAGVMLLIPQFRKWGGILAVLMLVTFMGYMGINYTALHGKDCSCFPVINLPLGMTLDFRTAVGPMFFVRDFFMLIPAAIAAWWAKPFQGLRTAAVILGAVAVFVGVNYGVAYGKHNGATAPETLTVDGKAINLRDGRYFIFFYDPECSHCNAAAKTMGTYTWKSNITPVAVPVRQQQWAEAFLKDNKWNAKTSLEWQKLKAVFPYENPPYGVVLEDGRQVGTVSLFEENGEPGVTLRKLGAIE
jgi:hypothetical protein